MRNPKLGELPAAVNSAKVVEVNTTLVVDMGEESPLPQNGRLVRGRTEATNIERHADAAIKGGFATL